MTASPIEGSICVSANSGGVGIVANQACFIAMSNEVRGQKFDRYNQILQYETRFCDP